MSGSILPSPAAAASHKPAAFPLGTINCHLYHYAGNNPVRYVDTDGEKIRIWFFNQESKLFRYGRYYIWDNESDCFINSYGNKITGNSFVDEITACIKYLKQSSLAKSMIDKLDKSDRFVTIKKSGIRTDAYTKGKNNIEIHFRTEMLLNLQDGTGSKNSTALNLSHEFVHAFDHIIDEMYEQESNNTNVDPKYFTKAEERAVFITNLIAEQLGEAIRPDYTSSYMEGRGTLSVTDFINKQ